MRPRCRKRPAGKLHARQLGEDGLGVWHLQPTWQRNDHRVADIGVLDGYLPEVSEMTIPGVGKGIRMKFQIFFTLPNGETDSFIIEGDTVNEIREKTDYEITKRGVVDAWSKELC